MTRIIESSGNLYKVEGERRVLLCAVLPSLICESDDGARINLSTLDLAESIPKLVEGQCPACDAALVVEARGAYNCTGCQRRYANNRGYRFPALVGDEVLRGVMDGMKIEEFMSTGIPVTRPSALKVPSGVDGAGICPKCNALTNKIGACTKCDWEPTQADRLWEQVVKLAGRVVHVTGTFGHTIGFDFRNASCKLTLDEDETGYKYRVRLTNITHDRIDEIVGRPRAVINWIATRLSRPDRPVNSRPVVNSPIQETGYRLDSRALRDVHNRVTQNRFQRLNQKTQED
jgi:hypothetical protein